MRPGISWLSSLTHDLVSEAPIDNPIMNSLTSSSTCSIGHIPSRSSSHSLSSECSLKLMLSVNAKIQCNFTFEVREFSRSLNIFLISVKVLVMLILGTDSVGGIFFGYLD